MKVILLASVPKVGSVNEIVEVSDGYAMNSLIPQGLARAANEKNIAALEKQIKENKARDDARKKEASEAIQSLNGETITLTTSANEQGTLFSAISSTDLSEIITKEKGIEVDPSFIELDQAIKETGPHKINVVLDDIKAVFTLNIEAESQK